MSTAERTPGFDEAHLRVLQARQLGLVTTLQLQELGMSSQAITRRRESGELERVLPRVYRSPLVVPGLQQRALAAVLWAGEQCVASHGTAAALWKMEVPATEALVELWVPSNRFPRHPGVRVHRGTVTAIDRRMVDRIPVTSAARTLIDLSGRLDNEALESAVEDVLHRGLTTPGALDRRLADLGGKGRIGAGKLGTLLQARDLAPLESRLEVKVWCLLRSAGFRPVRQYEVMIEGRRLRLDFAWPRLQVAVEAEGYRAHGGKLAHDGDRRRWAALVAAGWRIVPVTWADCAQQPQVFLDRVRAALLRSV